MTLCYKPGTVLGVVGNDAMNKQEEFLPSRSLWSSEKEIAPIVRIREAGCKGNCRVLWKHVARGPSIRQQVRDDLPQK